MNHLLRNRIIFIGSRITDVVATQVRALGTLGAPRCARRCPHSSIARQVTAPPSGGDAAAAKASLCPPAVRQVVASLLALDSLGEEDIRIYINTAGACGQGP